MILQTAADCRYSGTAADTYEILIADTVAMETNEHPFGQRLEFLEQQLFGFLAFWDNIDLRLLGPFHIFSQNGFMKQKPKFKI
jgi:hypothetical protein